MDDCQRFVVAPYVEVDQTVGVNFTGTVICAPTGNIRLPVRHDEEGSSIGTYAPLRTLRSRPWWLVQVTQYAATARDYLLKGIHHTDTLKWSGVDFLVVEHGAIVGLVFAARGGGALDECRRLYKRAVTILGGRYRGEVDNLS